MASQEDDVRPLDKITSSKAFTDATEGISVKTTSYESFLDGSKKSTFDCVLLTFMKAVSCDDLEMKQDYYDFYTMAPIIHYAVAKKEQDEEELKGVTTYLRKTCDKKLMTDDALMLGDLTNMEEDVKSLVSGISQMKAKYEELKSQTVVPAFSKFDKDGNGTIDPKELGQLSKDLGQEITEEQIEEAMKELDLNGDGVVDLEEFSRWYFTGMKSYGGVMKGLLQTKNSTLTIFDVLAKENITKIINEDKTMTKHRVKI